MITFAGSPGLSDRDIRRERVGAWDRDALSEREIQRTGPDVLALTSHTFAPVPAYLRRLQQLSELPASWDSYGARPIDINVLSYTARLLQPLAEAMVAPMPDIIPTVRGGIAMEWHNVRGEVGIELVPSGPYAPPQVTAYFADASTGEEWEKDLADVDAAEWGASFSKVAGWAE